MGKINYFYIVIYKINNINNINNIIIIYNILLLSLIKESNKST
jgi:hypothetical protein